MLALALMLIGQDAGYSFEAMSDVIERIMARSFWLLWLFLLVAGPLLKPAIASMSRASLNRSHLGLFLMANLAAAAGIALMAQHSSRTGLQQGCFDAVSWMISWSMGYEYWFVATHKSDL